MTLAQLESAEQQRQKKAASMPQLQPVAIPDSVEEHAAQTFAKITEKLKNQAHEGLGNPELERRVRELQAKWNAPSRHLNRREFQGEGWLAKLESLKSKLGTGVLWAFVGIRGPGKTQMAVELMRHQTEKRLKTARYASAIEVFCSLREPYADGATKRELAAISDWVRPELLIIDEAQERAETPWEDRLLTHIVDKRYNDEKDTILISNNTEDMLMRSLGKSIESRLCETGGVVEFNWESFRK